ncbi:MAG: cupin domain-containing protein [Chloroflexota bacterium]
MSEEERTGQQPGDAHEIEPLPADTGFYRVDDLPGFMPLPGVQMNLLTGSRTMVNWVRINPGGEVPEHSHPHEQLGLVLEGEIVMTISGESKRCQPGDCYIIAGGVIHSGAAGPNGCLVLDVFSPPRDDYRQAASE